MDAISSSLGIVAYLALFAGVGLLFLFANLLVGRFLRPADPHEEKQEIYECGEPTIGSSFVQFDLRFYVVALLFIIFDVEVAFFFPWATVFGKAMHLADERVAITADGTTLTETAEDLYLELGVRNFDAQGKLPLPQGDVHQEARKLALVTIVDICVFFAVLMVGFAYVWKRGDLDWVRAVSQERSLQRANAPPSSLETEQVVSA